MVLFGTGRGWESHACCLLACDSRSDLVGVVRGSLGALGVLWTLSVALLVVLWESLGGSRVGFGAPWRPAVVLSLLGGLIVGELALSWPL